MLHFTDLTEAQKLCECLAAPARVEIMQLVLSRRADSLDSLAKELHLTNGAITQHVKKLCDAGLIKLVQTPGKRGIAKRCVATVDRIIIDVSPELERKDESVFELALGSFSAAAINPYCAIASAAGWIGERDDPRYFTYPERTAAAMIYFNSGKIVWTLPAPGKRHRLTALSVSFEISSKPYGHGRTRETDVDFYLNDVKLGTHAVDGEFTDRPGLFTSPAFDGVCQYGKFRTVLINGDGTFFDGNKIGDLTVSDFNEIRSFGIGTENGVALFGKNCGDYDVGLRVTARFEQ